MAIRGGSAPVRASGVPPTQAPPAGGGAKFTHTDHCVLTPPPLVEGVKTLLSAGVIAFFIFQDNVHEEVSCFGD